MPNERRYGDDEVRKIFDHASVGSRAPGSESSESVDDHGLTLAELQEVGREVGLDPARIAEAAAELERAPSPIPASTLLGQPASVGRVVEIPRAPSDHEWEQLVAELRATFGAKGRVEASGSLREWSNGNLTALVEPSASGYRLRLYTIKASAFASRRLGTLGLVMGAFFTVISGLQGHADDLVVPVVLAAMGLAAFLSPLLTLPPWARQREEQMGHIARWTQALLDR